MNYTSFIKKITVITALVCMPVFASAQILPPLFLPGQQLNPNCSPGQVIGGQLCTVYPMSIGAGVAQSTPGSIPFIDASGALQQDNASLKWDENLKRLTLSQDLPVGSLNVQTQFNIGAGAKSAFISGDRFYVANSLDDTVSIVDISTSYAPITLATLLVGDNPVKILKNGNNLFVANLGSDTISVISGVTPLIGTVSVNFHDENMGFEIIGDYLYTTTFGELVIIDISNPSSLSIAGSVNLASAVALRNLTIRGNYAYVQDANKIFIIDVSNPTSPSLVNTITTASNQGTLFFNGNHTFTITNDGVLHIIDNSNPVIASVIHTVSLGVTGSFTAPVFSGNNLILINNAGTTSTTIRVLDISNIATASIVQSLAISGIGMPRDPIVIGNYMFLLTPRPSQAAISVFDISVPVDIALVAQLTSLGAGVSTGFPVLFNNYIMFLTSVSSVPKLSFINISDPLQPVLVESVAVLSNSNTPIISNGFAYIVNSGASVFTAMSLSNILPIISPVDVVSLVIDGTIQSKILSGTGSFQLSSDMEGNIIPTYSDLSLKTNVSDVDGALDKIRMLQGRYFYWKDPSKMGVRREIGFIAQEIEQYVPEVVRETGIYKTVNYSNLTALLTEGVKELDLRLATLESLAGLDEQSATQSLFARFAEFLKSTATKVIGGVVRFTGEVFAPKATVELLCVGSSTNSICITQDQLNQLLQQANITPISSDSSQSSPSPIPESNDSNTEPQDETTETTDSNESASSEDDTAIIIDTPEPVITNEEEDNQTDNDE